MSLLFVPRPRPEQFENSPCHYEPQDDLEHIPLTQDALKLLASTLPQPISTVRYSNRENNYLFSDRESVYCPSLLATSESNSTRQSSLLTPSESSHELPLTLLDSSPPFGKTPNARHGPPAKKIEKGVNLDNLFDIDFGGFRRDSTIDFLPDFDDIDNYVPDERVAARLEEEREMEKARLLYERELEDDYPVTVARKPIMPTSLWISQPRHIMTPNFVPSPQSTELTIPVSSSTVEASASSEYFPKSQSSTGSVDTASTTTTDITVPSIDGSCSEVDDEFVTTILTYLSLNHNSMALKFDSELSFGSDLSVEDVRKDRKVALKSYIERYISQNPDVSL